jgi:hypothetical protein
MNFLLALFFILPTAPPPIAVLVDVHPSFMDAYILTTRPTPYTFTCTAHVFDASLKTGLLDVKLIAERGKTTVATNAHGEYSVDFTVKMNDAGDLADTRVVVQRNGAVISDQRNTTTLKQPPFAR